MNKRMVALAKAKMPSYHVEDKIIDDMGRSLSFIAMGVLEAKTDEFEGKERKLTNFFEYVQQEKAKGEIASDCGVEELVNEAKGSRSYIYEACKEIPFSQLLFLANIKPRTASRNPNLKMYLQIGFCIVGVWMDRVLKDHYRNMNKADRIKVFADMVNWIDSYQRKYQSNEGIREQFIEDLKWDLVKGEKVIEES